MTAPGFTDPVDAARYAIYRQDQVDEYGTWVAAHNITVGGVLAFLADMPVPASTVSTQGWDADGTVKPAPPRPDDTTTRAEQVKARLAVLDAERQALTAELSGAPAEPGPYDGWKVDELRAELRARDLPDGGRKDDLLARLRAVDETSGDEKSEKSEDE